MKKSMTKWSLFQECNTGSIFRSLLMYFFTLKEPRMKNRSILSIDTEKAVDKILPQIFS